MQRKPLPASVASQVPSVQKNPSATVSDWGPSLANTVTRSPHLFLTHSGHANKSYSHFTGEGGLQRLVTKQASDHMASSTQDFNLDLLILKPVYPLRTTQTSSSNTYTNALHLNARFSFHVSFQKTGTIYYHDHSGDQPSIS